MLAGYVTEDLLRVTSVHLLNIYWYNLKYTLFLGATFDFQSSLEEGGGKTIIILRFNIDKVMPTYIVCSKLVTHEPSV